ncbi:Winged helix-turn helix [Sinorhizobium sp. NFACC03]|nr:Winged helix-turn helix [Sinorhizobium sp. NFACC03]
MGLIAMSERDLQRIEVLSKVIAGRMTLVSAAHVLGLSTRQVRRLLERIGAGGAASLRHQAIGRPSNNRICDGVRDYAMAIVRERYADFGPTLAAEKLAERDGLTVSRETLRQWMSEAGLWLSRKQRRTFHQPRLRREAYGELVQIDGSEHRWFEDRGDPCSLLVFIDDATGKLMQLRFVRSESAFSYFEALELYLKAWCSSRLLFRQAFGVPGCEEGCQGRPGHDPIRAGALSWRRSLRKGHTVAARSGRLFGRHIEFEMDAVIRKLDTILMPIDDTRIDKCCHVAMNGLHITVHAPGNLADGKRALSGQSLNDGETQGG